MDWQEVIAIMAIATLLGGIFAMIWRGAQRIESKADKSELAALRSEFTEHRVGVARDYVAKEALHATESRIMDGIRHLGERIDRMFTPASSDGR